jgi:hypothetical protein
MKLPEIKKTAKKFFLSESGSITKKSIITQGIILSLFAATVEAVPIAGGKDCDCSRCNDEVLITPAGAFSDDPEGMSIRRSSYYDKERNVHDEGVTVTKSGEAPCECSAGGDYDDHGNAVAEAYIKIDYPLYKWEGTVTCEEGRYGNGCDHCSSGHAGCRIRFEIPDYKHNNEISLQKISDSTIAGKHQHSLPDRTIKIASGYDYEQDGTLIGERDNNHGSCS